MPKTNTNKLTFGILEVLAIILSFLYTFLYIKELKICFLFGFIGAAIYVYLCFKKKIYVESSLQLFYVFMAVYGWVNWSRKPNPIEFTQNEHIILLVSSVVLTILVGFLFQKFSDTKLPFIDAFTSIFSVSATWLMVNYIHETWLYFIAVNFVAMFLYYTRGLKWSVLLYFVYFTISVIEYFKLKENFEFLKVIFD